MKDAVTGLNRKVLDRANLVEIGQVPLQIQTMPANVPQAMPLGSEFLMADNLVLSRCTHHREMVHEVVTLLEAMNGILANADAQIGFRVRDEICFYLLDNAQYGLMSQERPHEPGERLGSRHFTKDFTSHSRDGCCGGIGDDGPL